MKGRELFQTSVRAVIIAKMQRNSTEEETDQEEKVSMVRWKEGGIGEMGVHETDGLGLRDDTPFPS